VSAYIFEEVLQNLNRSGHSRAVIERAQTRFADIVHSAQTVDGPTQTQIRAIELEARRSDPRVQAMGEAFGIQDKDVPLVVFARQCAQDLGESVTIYTADREFSRFDPSPYFDDLGMKYVDCPD
jgi:hypothetical protein